MCEIGNRNRVKAGGGDEAFSELRSCLCAESELPRGLEVRAISRLLRAHGGSFNMARVGCSISMSVFTLNFIS